jgi:thioredoxin-like negative regulator of GroEL
MKVCVLYQPESENSRPVEEFAHDFQKQHNVKFELVSVQTREGSALASLYDIVRYPAVMALRDDGQLLQIWQGDQMPLMSEVAAYVSA